MGSSCLASTFNLLSWTPLWLLSQIHSFPWTDLQELSLHSVCALHIQHVKWYTSTETLRAPLTLDGVRLDVVDWFTYLGSCLRNDGSIRSELDPRISKAGGVYANLLHTWLRGDVSLPEEGCVYNVTVCPVLLWKCEMRPLHQEVHRLELFYHRCLRQLARVGWSDKVI